MSDLVDQQDHQFQSDVRHYEGEHIVEQWLNAYQIEKEREFIKCIDRLIPRDKLKLLDIGCGIGLHTALWSEQGKQVTASDLSTKFRDHIRATYSFPFIRVDVLNCEIQDHYDICFCMAISTILLGQRLRFRTFEMLARLVHPDSFMVLVGPSNQRAFRIGDGSNPLHSFDQSDLRKLDEVGFEVERRFYWSTAPRWLWRMPRMRPCARVIEALGNRLRFGSRIVIVCRRRSLGRPDPTSSFQDLRKSR